MGGHVVQGHVDTTGKLNSLIPLASDLDNTDWRMSIEVPDSIMPNIIPQGSITVDGISLTVAKIVEKCIEIAIIPHTYKSTNLRSLMAGSEVNLEADALSRYAQKQMESRPQTTVPVFETPATLYAAPVYAVSAPISTWTNEVAPQPLDPAPAVAESPKMVQSTDGWLTLNYLMENGY
jgi:hypothetical protein